jgi:hypothetical protein
VPLVPAAISGTDHLLRFRPIRVACGAPIPVDDLRDLPRRVQAEHATRRLMDAIDELRRTL